MGKNGHQIIYVGQKGIEEVLNRYDFPKGEVVEKFSEELHADVLIQHNCHSIGEDEVIKTNTKTIVVDEFGGIDKVTLSQS